MFLVVGRKSRQSHGFLQKNKWTVQCKLDRISCFLLIDILQLKLMQLQPQSIAQSTTWGNLWVNSSAFFQFCSISIQFEHILNKDRTEIEDRQLKRSSGCLTCTCDYIQARREPLTDLSLSVLNSIQFLFNFCAISDHFPLKFHSMELKLNGKSR